MRTHLMAAVAALGLLGGTAWAAGDSDSASKASPSSSASSAQRDAGSGSSAASSSGQMMTQAELQKQLGKDITTQSGEKVGKLNDVILDSSGKPQQAVIDLNDSAKNVAVSFAELQQSGGQWTLRNQSKQQLAGMKDFQYDSSTVSLNHPSGASSSSSGRSGASGSSASPGSVPSSPSSIPGSGASPGSSASSPGSSGATTTPPAGSSSKTSP